MVNGNRYFYLHICSIAARWIPSIESKICTPSGNFKEFVMFQTSFFRLNCFMFGSFFSLSFSTIQSKVGMKILFFSRQKNDVCRCILLQAWFCEPNKVNTNANKLSQWNEEHVCWCSSDRLFFFFFDSEHKMHVWPEVKCFFPVHSFLYCSSLKLYHIRDNHQCERFARQSEIVFCSLVVPHIHEAPMYVCAWAINENKLNTKKNNDMKSSKRNSTLKNTNVPTGEFSNLEHKHLGAFC